MKFDPAREIQELKQFGEFGGVNPSITDSATYTFMEADTMFKTFSEDTGRYLYSRHWNPSNKFLAEALAAMEGTESAWVTASGMAAITCTMLQICSAGDHIVSSETIYGGSFAFMKNYLPKFNIDVTFVNTSNLEAVKAAMRPNTKMVYAEVMSNPLLRIANLPELAKIAHAGKAQLVIDNTFTPMMVNPIKHGADVVVYSMTKYINGKNDCVAGAICGSTDFINALSSVNDGSAMLLGPVLDPLRSSSILKNLHTLHIRMKQHSYNAMYLSQRFKEIGLKSNYPGMEEHVDHQLFNTILNKEYGYGGMISIDMETVERANELMERMQLADVGYLAVSLGYFKTLFSNSGKSTSSEVPEEIQREMGMSEGLIRFSMGLDNDIEHTFESIKGCLKEMKLL